MPAPAPAWFLLVLGLASVLAKETDHIAKTSSARLLHREKRITNGEPANPVPAWYAGIKYNDPATNTNNFVCGAVIMTKHIVLTAAHCVKNRDPHSLTVVAFSLAPGNQAQSLGVRRFVCHEYFGDRGEGMINDVAVLEVFQELLIGTPDLPVIADMRNTPYAKARCSFYGVAKFTGQREHPQQAPMAIIRKRQDRGGIGQDCGHRIVGLSSLTRNGNPMIQAPSWRFLRKKERFCAETAINVGHPRAVIEAPLCMLQGDYGGPITCSTRNQVDGLHTDTYTGRRPDMTTDTVYTFTLLSLYKDWIMQHLRHFNQSRTAGTGAPGLQLGTAQGPSVPQMAHGGTQGLPQGHGQVSGPQQMSHGGGASSSAHHSNDPSVSGPPAKRQRFVAQDAAGPSWAASAPVHYQSPAGTGQFYSGYAAYPQQQQLQAQPHLQGQPASSAQLPNIVAVGWPFARYHQGYGHNPAASSQYQQSSGQYVGSSQGQGPQHYGGASSHYQGSGQIAGSSQGQGPQHYGGASSQYQGSGQDAGSSQGQGPQHYGGASSHYQGSGQIARSSQGQGPQHYGGASSQYQGSGQIAGSSQGQGPQHYGGASSQNQSGGGQVAAGVQGPGLQYYTGYSGQIAGGSQGQAPQHYGGASSQNQSGCGQVAGGAQGPGPQYYTGSSSQNQSGSGQVAGGAQGPGLQYYTGYSGQIAGGSQGQGPQHYGGASSHYQGSGQTAGGSQGQGPQHYGGASSQYQGSGQVAGSSQGQGPQHYGGASSQYQSSSGQQGASSGAQPAVDSELLPPIPLPQSPLPFDALDLSQYDVHDYQKDPYRK